MYTKIKILVSMGGVWNKIFLSVILFCFITDLKATENKQNRVDRDTLPTAQLITFLQNMNVSSYTGKAVDTFLLAIPANLYNLAIYGGQNSQGALFRANYITADFTPDPSGVGVKIYVEEYTHMNRYSPTATWDINLFRKEKISRIEVWKDQNTCINIQ